MMSSKKHVAFNFLGSLLISALALGGCDEDNGTAQLSDAEVSGDSSGWQGDDQGVVAVGDGSVAIEDDSGEPWVCRLTTCAGKLLACGDCEDNDGDGRVDWQDQECLGPCDNTEGPALAAGVGGDTADNCKVDCYFDFGNGSGNDACTWDHRCDPLEPETGAACQYDETMVGGKKCPEPQDPACAENCLPFTPNGCDCFGCCTFPDLAGQGENGADAFVWIGAMDDTNQGTCTFADILDTDRCPRCTPVPGCYNECGPCEVCIGRPLPPAECFETPDGGSTSSDGGAVPPSSQCPGGEPPCGLAGQAVCAEGFYCVSGCCQAVFIE